MSRPGRLRERCAEIVSKALGHVLSPEWVHPVTGFWKKVDVYRWEVHAPIDNVPSLGCWASMTVFVRDCGREGICHISDGEIWPGPRKDS